MGLTDLKEEGGSFFIAGGAGSKVPFGLVRASLPSLSMFERRAPAFRTAALVFINDDGCVFTAAAEVLSFAVPRAELIVTKA